MTADEGDFTVSLECGAIKLNQPARVNSDPRFEFKPEDRRARYDAAVRALVLSQRMGLAITAAKSIGRDVDKIGQDLKTRMDAPPELVQAFATFRDKAKALENEIVPKDLVSLASRDLALRGTLNATVIGLTASVIGYPAAPTQTDLQQLAELEAIIDSQVRRVNELIATDLPQINDVLKRNALTPLGVPPPIK